MEKKICQECQEYLNGICHNPLCAYINPYSSDYSYIEVKPNDSCTLFRSKNN